MRSRILFTVVSAVMTLTACSGKDGPDVFDAGADMGRDAGADLGPGDATIDGGHDLGAVVDIGADAGFAPEPPAFGSFTFAPCRLTAGVECASFSVPIDHEDARSGTMSMTAYRRVHTGNGPALGTLFFSAGGPGGIINAPDLIGLQSAIGPGLAAAFDLVAWTQRAAFLSGHVDCGNSENIYLRGDWSPDDAEEDAALDDVLATFAADCDAAAGPLLPHVGPVDHARDLEWLRIGAGLDEIFFYAPSYASMYATVYAELFPGRLRRGVLDSPIPPSATILDWARGQFAAGLARLEEVLAECEADPNCVFQPVGSKRQGLIDLDASLDGSDVIPQTRFDVATEEAPYIYGGEAEYAVQVLGMFEAARVGDGSKVDATLRELNLPQDDGAYLAQVCTHSERPTMAELDALRDELFAQMPPLAAYFSNFVRVCAFWPAEGKRAAAPVVAPDTFMVLAGSRDYAIPMEWPETLAAELGAPLVVTSVYGHGALGDDMEDCARAAVTGWLLDGTTPAGCN